MASTIHSLAVKLAVRDREFHSKMKRAAGTTKGVNAKMIAMGAAAAGAVVGVVALTKAWQTATRVGRLLWNELEKQRKLIDDLAKDSKKLNVLPGTLKELRLQAGLFAGTEAEQLDKAMARMRVVLRDIAFGSGQQAAKALADLGIRFEDIENLNTDEQFRLIQAAMARMGNTATTAGHANQIFGRAAKDLMPFLTAMPDELDKSTASMQGLFRAMDRANFEDMEDFNDRITRMKEAFQISKTLVVDQLSPALSVAAEDWEKFDWHNFQSETDLLIASLEELVVILGGLPDRLMVVAGFFDDYSKKLAFMIEAHKALDDGDLGAAMRNIVAAEVVRPGEGINRRMAQVEINDMHRRIAIENRRAEREQRRLGFDSSAGIGMGGLGFQVNLARIIAGAEKDRRGEFELARNAYELSKDARNQRQELIEAIKGTGGKTVVTWEDAAK